MPVRSIGIAVFSDHDRRAFMMRYRSAPGRRRARSRQRREEAAGAVGPNRRADRQVGRRSAQADLSLDPRLDLPADWRSGSELDPKLDPPAGAHIADNDDPAEVAQLFGPAGSGVDLALDSGGGSVSQTTC